MNRAVRILLILLVGSLVLWESISWGTRTWVKYGILKQPLPSITTLMPTSVVPLIITTLLIVLLIAITASAVIRSKKILGLIPLGDLVRHVVILGPTGSGKTTVAKAIIEKVLRSTKSKVVVIDWKGEYSQFTPMATIIRKINVWNVPGDTPREKALAATELIREMSKDVVEVTPASSLLLLRVLEEEYKRGVPTTEKVMRILEKNAEMASREGRYAESNMYLALARRLFVLLVDEERRAENIQGDSQVVIYDLGSLPSIYIKTLYANHVLATLYRSAMKAGISHQVKMLLVAEETQNYIRPRRHDELPSIGERLIFELRSCGVGVVLICPDPGLLPEPVTKDVATIIATSPDSLPRFALERYLFRASLEEAEGTLKKLKKAKATIYYKGNLYFLRRLPKPPKILKARPKGDRMGAKAGVGSQRAWLILPHRSPGRPTVVEVKEEEVTEEPKVVEVEEMKVEERPKVIEVKVAEVAEEPLKLEEEELEEEPEVIEVKEPEPMAEPIEEKAEGPVVEVEEAKTAEEEEAEMVEEEVPMAVEPEPAPEGPPIPSSLPYRGSLCPAGRSATLGRVLF